MWGERWTGVAARSSGVHSEVSPSPLSWSETCYSTGQGQGIGKCPLNDLIRQFFHHLQNFGQSVRGPPLTGCQGNGIESCHNDLPAYKTPSCCHGDKTAVLQGEMAVHAQRSCHGDSVPRAGRVVQQLVRECCRRGQRPQQCCVAQCSHSVASYYSPPTP